MTESDLLWSENIQIHGSYWYYSTWKWSYIIIWCSMKCKILIHILLQKYQAVFLPKLISRDKLLWAGDTFGSTDCGISVGCRSLRSPWFRLRVSNSLDKHLWVIWRSATVGGGLFLNLQQLGSWLSKFNVCYCWSFSDTQTHPDLLLLFSFFPTVLNNCSFNSFGSQLPLIHLYLTHLLHTHTPVHKQ